MFQELNVRVLSPSPGGLERTPWSGRRSHFCVAIKKKSLLQTYGETLMHINWANFKYMTQWILHTHILLDPTTRLTHRTFLTPPTLKGSRLWPLSPQWASSVFMPGVSRLILRGQSWVCFSPRLSHHVCQLSVLLQIIPGHNNSTGYLSLLLLMNMRLLLI